MSKEVDVLLERKEKKNFHLEGVLNDKGDFDGPLELLLYFIQENNANIYDIPIATITDEYLEWIKEHDTDTNDLADFYAMASKLIYIKTKLLLPELTVLEEEFEDPREELVERLIEYQKYKKLSDILSGNNREGTLKIERPDSSFVLPFEDSELFHSLTLDDLRRTFSEMLKNTPPSMIFNIYEEVTENEKRALLYELLDQKRVIALRELVVNPSNPLDVICSFMAILEEMKNRLISVYQAFPYSEILIKKRTEEDDELLKGTKKTEEVIKPTSKSAKSIDIIKRDDDLTSVNSVNMALKEQSEDNFSYNDEEIEIDE